MQSRGGFRRGRGCVEKYMEELQDVTFMDLEKAYDGVDRNAMSLDNTECSVPWWSEFKGFMRGVSVSGSSKSWFKTRVAKYVYVWSSEESEVGVTGRGAPLRVSVDDRERKVSRLLFADDSEE